MMRQALSDQQDERHSPLHRFPMMAGASFFVSRYSDTLADLVTILDCGPRGGISRWWRDI